VNLTRTIIKYADIHGTFPWALPRARARERLLQKLS